MPPRITESKSQQQKSCCAIQQSQWQEHCSAAELTAPFYFGMHSEPGEAPAEVSRMTCAKSVCVLLSAHLDADLVQQAKVLSWNPVEQIALRGDYSIDRKFSSGSKIPMYTRFDLSTVPPKKIDSKLQLDMFLLHPESRPTVVEVGKQPYTLCPGDLFFCNATAELSFSSQHAVLYRWVVYSLEDKKVELRLN